MRTDIEYLDKIEKIARKYDKKETTAEYAMTAIVSIFKELWD